MKTAITVKITSEDQTDYEKIVSLLEIGYKVLATSSCMFDDQTKKHRIFLSLEEQ